MRIRIALLITMTVLILSLFASCAKPFERMTAAELLDLGEKHLLEVDYEQALVQFLKVIEIEPMNPRGYTGAAEAYVGLTQTESAIEILRRGDERTSDDNIDAMLIELLLVDGLELPKSDSQNQSDNNIEGSDFASEAIQIPKEDINSENTLRIELTNLTDGDIFSFTDIEQWVSPLGLSLDDIIVEYDCDEYAVDELKSGRANSEYSGDWVVTQAPFELCVNSNTLTVSKVTITDNSPIEGPRGLRIGMAMEDALYLFACANEDAIEFVKNPINDREAMQTWLQVYNLGAGQFDATISIYGNAYDIYSSDYAVIYYDYSAGFTLHVYCMDGFVNRIFAGTV